MLLVSGGSYYYFSSAVDPVTSVYRIETEYKVRKKWFGGMGSGFLVSGQDILVTNNHVIRGRKNKPVERVKISYIDNGSVKSRSARVLWTDSDQDLAIIKASGPLPGQAVMMANIAQDQLRLKANVTAIGYPYVVKKFFDMYKGSLDKRGQDEVDLAPTVSTGTVQRIVPTLPRLLIQHGADIEKGNSGGPLFDDCNRVIGVNTLGGWAHVNVDDLKRVWRKKGQKVAINAPKSINVAVHSQEVIKALRREGIQMNLSSATCRAGLAGTGQMTIGAALALALSALLLAAFTFMRKPEVISETYTQYKRREDGTGGAQALVTPQPSAGAAATVKHAAPTRKLQDAFKLRALNHGKHADLSTYSAKLAAGGVIIGRSSDVSDVVMDDDSVSRSHVRLIANSQGGLSITDLGSANGTQVNGQTITANQPIPLSRGDKLIMGELEFLIEAIEKQSAGTIGDQWLLSGFDRKGNVIQHVLASPVGQSSGPILRVICTIGRGSNCELAIDDDSVSREHASIGFTPGTGLSIRDLGSVNGTYVDGSGIGTDYKPLSSAKAVKFGEVSLSLSKVK